MQIYFIRHGQSENNLLWSNPNYQKIRKNEPLLTDVGHQQAHKIAKTVMSRPMNGHSGQWDPYNTAGFGITHIYCSLMLRAVQTATPIAQALELPLKALPSLHETGGMTAYDPENDAEVGLPGPNRHYFAQHYPHVQLPDDLNEQGWWGGRPLETIAERLARGHQVLNYLITQHGETQDRVALVSHGGFYNYFLHAIFQNLSPNQQEWCFLLNTSISRIDYEPTPHRNWGLIYSNRCDHLPHDLITH
jgi:2,3-bisphosphoglycerate-dependent phosphoglycerate mutase